MSTLPEALDAYYNARKELDEGRRCIDAHKWSYFGQQFRDKVEDAEAAITKAVETLIDDRLRALGILQ